MSWAGVAVAGATVVGAVVDSQSSKKAEKSRRKGAQRGIEAQERALTAAEQRTQPFLDIGLAAGGPLADLLGINVANPEIANLQSQLESLDAQIEAGPPVIQQTRRSSGGLLGGALGNVLSGGSIGGTLTGNFIGRETGSRVNAGSTTGEFDLEGLQAQRADLANQIQTLQGADEKRFASRGRQGIDEINPVLSFLREEGFQDIQESAAAQGRLGAGGTLKDLTRFNTGLASTIVPQLQNQRFNQLFNLLGLGANAASGQATAQLGTGANIANLQGQIGEAGAIGAQQQGQAINTGISGLTGVLGAQQGGAFAAQGQKPQGFNFLNQTPSNQVGGIQNPNLFGGFS